MGTSRTSKGPSPKKPLKRFKGEKDTWNYLLRRVEGKDGVEQRTDEQLYELARYVDAASALEGITSALYPLLNWLMSGVLLSTTIPEEALRRFDPLPQPLPEELQRFVPYYQAADHVLMKLHNLMRAEKELVWSFIALRHLCEELGINRRYLRGWAGNHQMLAAFAQLAEKRLELKPRIEPKDMEAVVQLLGIRSGERDFMEESKGLDKRREAWSTEMKKVRKTFLPLLRSFLAGETAGSGLEVYDPKRHRVRRSRPAKTTKRRKQAGSK